MHGLGDENARIVRSELKEERRAILHHRNELLIAHPGRIKQNVVTEVPDGIDHLTGVINRSVVRTQLNHCQAEGALQFGFFRRHFTH